MKRFKKMMALVIATMMIAMYAVPMSVFAADPTYSITVENTESSISIAGKTYNAYKLFDMTYNTAKTAYAYSIDSDGDGAWAWDTIKGTAGANGVYTNSTYGLKFTPSAADPTVYAVEQISTMTAEQTRALADALESKKPSTNNGTATVATGAETCTINTNPNAAGYYLVYGTAASADPNTGDDEIVAAVALTSTNPTATVNPKAGIPTLDKEITGVLEEGSVTEVDGAVQADGQAAVAKVGSKVEYKITATTPDLTGYDDYTFIVGDSISDGLTYDKSSFVLTIDGTTATYSTTVTTGNTGDNELIFASGDKSFSLTIPYSVLKAAGEDKNIVLTYKCTVNSNALTTDYENNTANLEYSRTPYDDETNHTPDKKTYVIDLNLDVLKVDGTDTTVTLDGAQFKLYKEVETTTGGTPESYNAVAAWVDGTTTYYYEDGGNYTAVDCLDSVAFDTAVAEHTTLYTKTEAVGGTTSTAKKYYQWDSINNVVKWVDAQASGDTFTTTTGGNLTQQVRGLDMGEYYFEETKAPEGYNILSAPVKVVISVDDTTTDKVTYTATYGGETATVTNGTVDLAAAQNEDQPVATGTIANNGGSILPSTGGIGTTLFYLIGAILVIGAGVVLVTRRRVNSEE